MLYNDVLLHIDGEWREGRGEPIPVINPASEEVLGSVAFATLKDVELAVSASERGFLSWRDVPAFDRYRLMRSAAINVRENSEGIAAVLTLEQGKPKSEARAEVAGAADLIDWFAEEARRGYGRIVPSRAQGIEQLVRKEPVGPVAAFTPWNFPLNQAVRKIAAAVATGCSIVIKGPEETPASCAALVKAFVDAGLPPGVLNLVYGDPEEISSFLIPHPSIRKVSFTGSTLVGKKLASLAGAQMKRVTMELGGHAPVIIFDDADVGRAVKLMAGAKYRNAGQICAAPTRFLIQQRVYDDFVHNFVEAARSIIVGDGNDDGVTMGPLANRRRLDAMMSLTSDAIERGGRIEVGGARVGNRGFFFEPTVISGVGADARVMNEEPFGPLALVSQFESYEEAVTEANRLPYGLAAYSFTGSMKTAEKLSRDVESGMIGVNELGFSMPELPFGGIKDSGYGAEGGLEALDNYYNTKLVIRSS